jgi:ATP-dependent Clp protease ATP-binding subunit ClpA
VLFGKLKAGGHVRVVVVTGENGATELGFEFPDGPVTPKPEKIEPAPRKAPRRKAGTAAVRAKPKKPSGDGGPRPRTTVPKVPLVTA